MNIERKQATTTDSVQIRTNRTRLKAWGQVGELLCVVSVLLSLFVFCPVRGLHGSTQATLNDSVSHLSNQTSITADHEGAIIVNQPVMAVRPSAESGDNRVTTEASATKKSVPEAKKSKRKKSQRKSASSSKNSQQHHRRKNQSLSQEVDIHPNQELLPPDQTCLISEVCMRNGKLGYCFKPHRPIQYERDNRDTEDFYDMLLDNCPHFFDSNENLLSPLCCSPEQEETISRLNANIDLIRRSCPSCLVNVKKLFCNLFCAPNQRDFVRIERIKGETVMEVTYAISAHFVDNFFSSCRDVRVFGAYILDYEYGCGKLKRANCTPNEFMRVLGSLSEIPFKFKPMIVSDTSATFHSDQKWPRALMNDTAYECHQAPPNHSSCQCDHCPRVCQNNGQKGKHNNLTPSVNSFKPKNVHTNKNVNVKSNSASIANSLGSLSWIKIVILFCMLHLGN